MVSTKTPAKSAVRTTPLDRLLAPPMFWASVVFVALVAGLMFSSRIDLPTANYIVLVWGLAVVYPLFMLESLIHWAVDGNFRGHRVLYWMIPPLRMGGRDHVNGQSIWLPWIGWAEANRDLQKRVERAFSVPMVAIALMVLPLLGFEYYFWARNVVPDWRLMAFLRYCESIIWMAFAVEFVVMLSIVDKKFRYCKEHWIDLAIICLPLIGFLRVLRLGQVWRIHHLTKLGRVYRLRALSLRVFRGLLVLQFMDRFTKRDPKKRLAILREQFEEMSAELNELCSEIEELEQKISEQPEQP